MQSSREADARDQRARRECPVRTATPDATRQSRVCVVSGVAVRIGNFFNVQWLHFTVDMYQSGLTAPIPRTVYQYFSAYPLLPFLVPHFILFGSVQ